MVKYIKQGPRNARSQTHFHPHTTEERERVYVNKIERERKSICEQEKEEMATRKRERGFVNKRERERESLMCAGWFYRAGGFLIESEIQNVCVFLSELGTKRENEWERERDRKSGMKNVVGESRILPRCSLSAHDNKSHEVSLSLCHSHQFLSLSCSQMLALFLVTHILSLSLVYTLFLSLLLTGPHSPATHSVSQIYCLFGWTSR